MNRDLLFLTPNAGYGVPKYTATRNNQLCTRVLLVDLKVLGRPGNETAGNGLWDSRQREYFGLHFLI